MLSTTLDPRFLAAPPKGASAKDYRGFVTSLLDWSKFASEPWARVRLSKRTAECLDTDKCYPFPAALKDEMRLVGVDEYDVKTIKLVVDKLFRFTLCFEDDCAFSDVLHSALTTTPDILQPGPTPNLSADAARCLLILAVLSRYCERFLGTGFATRRLGVSRSVRVTAVLEAVDHSRGDLHGLPNLPFTLDTQVNGYHDLAGLLANADAPIAFLNAQNDDEARLAIRLSLYQSRTRSGPAPDWFVQPRFFISDPFVARAQQCCGTDRNLAGLLLQSCVEAIDRFNLQRGHAIRTKKGGGSEQLKINSHKAHRHNISADYHLHYWERADGLTELAWVSHPHDDMWIPNPQ